VEFARLLAALRRHWIVVVLSLIAGAAGGWFVGHSGSKTFQATSQSLVTIPAARSLADQFAGSQLSANYVQTYAKVATSLPVAQKVIDELGLSETPNQVANSLQATPEASTYIIDITATSDDPVRAKQLADAAASALQAEVAELEAGKPQKVQAQVLQLATLPTAPISPKPKLDLIVGMLIGLVAGAAAAGLLESLDRTIRTQAVAEAVLETPMLAIVPRRSGSDGLVVGSKRGHEGEPYRSLRTSLRFVDPDNPLQSLLITSATPGDGKSTTAANLALAMALAGEDVILVDADLRRGGLAQVFGLEAAVGLTSVVIGQVPLAQALQSYGRNLRLLMSGRLPPNPSELLGSQLFNQLLRQLTEMADIVIVDAPPVLPVADALALSVQVDGVLLVVRHSVTQRAAAAEARRRLESMGAKLVGHVLNAVPPSASRGYYADYAYETVPVPPLESGASRS
jgi:succinoglycan biosynthesis transport protein ExoP